MKKFSFIGLLLVSMIYAGCEKLPSVDGSSTLDWSDGGYRLMYTTQNTAVFRDMGEDYHEYFQFNDRQDFNGNILTGSHQMDGTVVLYNLKPSTTYYYRYIEKDGFGGIKASPAESFQTKDEKYKIVSVTENVYYSSSWDGYDVSFEYGITNNGFPQDYYYNLMGVFYYKLSSEDFKTQSVKIGIGRDRLDYSMHITSDKSEEMTYWLVLYNNPGYLENPSDYMIVYQGDKKTVNLTK